MGVTWRFDGDDLLCGVGADWNEFALANGGGACVPPPIGQPLAGFVSGPDLCVVWRAILGLSRRDPDRTLRLTYRCDSPAERRIMTATVTGNHRAEVAIVSEIGQRQPRPSVPLLDATVPARSGEMIRMCGWCARVKVDDWVDVEEGCRRLDLLELESGPLPRITHGICNDCRVAVTGGLDLVGGAHRR
ncbi:hypothetical protein BJ973_000007 [Actinoplanes tereljensis]|uniref:Uncharacterized protein n=1 Tax=Paractinoplanes tereljensis TaxID=571912 RepID=A0A919NEW7_9ACTN|nr:hypothetical protein [Actinoplanes tereljensis]GIF17290.1 hypothetical protein Ate02nite_00200 [Actinoplanes tereljensis]